MVPCCFSKLINLNIEWIGFVMAIKLKASTDTKAYLIMTILRVSTPDLLKSSLGLRVFGLGWRRCGQVSPGSLESSPDWREWLSG